jgi:hypothetical protein
MTPNLQQGEPSTTAHPPERARRPSLSQAILTAVLAIVLYLALVICAWGFVSLLTDTDIIPERVGPLIGPIIAATATVIVFVGCLAQIRNGRGWLVPVVTGASVYLVPAVLGALIVVVSRADPAAGLLFFAARATTPYIPAAAVIAAVVVVLVPFASGRSVRAS